MNKNETRTLWISLAAGVFAVFLLFSWSQEQKGKIREKLGKEKQVVVALRDIPEMTPIDDTMITLRSQPEDYIEPAALSDVELAIGQLAAAPIKRGEQILDTKLLLPSKITGLAMEVSPGKRAVTIPSNDMNGVSRLIKPGDRIDVVASLSVGKGANARTEVKTILQDVVVLATGTNISNQIPIKVQEDKRGNYSIENLKMNTNYSSITLEVPQQDTQKLIYLMSTGGGIYLTLRNPNDRNRNSLRTTRSESIILQPKKATPRRPSSRRPGSSARPNGPPAIPGGLTPSREINPPNRAGGFRDV